MTEAEVKEDRNNEGSKEIGLGKEAAIQAEVQAAQLRSTVPLEVRMKQFKELLAEKDVSIDTHVLICFESI